MASLVTRKSGLRFVQFVNAAGERRTVTLGKIAPREADRIRDKIEQLATARRNGLEPSSDVQHWLAKVGDDLHSKLVAVGLADPREKPKAVTLGDFLSAYLALRADVKGSTATVYGHTRRCLVGFFGADKALSDITPGDATAWRLWLVTEQKLSDNTVRRRCGFAKQFFRHAVKQRLITENPFAELTAAVHGNVSRFHFLTTDDARKVLEACPDVQWRLLFALSRFGGLRIPSEALALKWSDINWERNRMIVPVPKLAHLGERHATRVVPMFPELRPYLEQAFEQAEPGAEFVITRYRDGTQNLRTQLGKIIRRSGLKPWPKLWHNLRASRQTELAARFPLHVVCSWIGNSPEIAREHYLSVTEADFTQAVTVTVDATCSALHGAQQSGAEMARNAPQPKQATPQFS